MAENIKNTRGKRSHAYAFKDNFWNKKRIEGNYKISDMAELLECPYSTAGAYFGGVMMPREDAIKKLCEFFGVDEIEGTREFLNAHKAYDAEKQKGRKLKIKAEEPEPTKTTPIKQLDTFEKVEEPKAPEPITRKDKKDIDYSSVFEIVYGKLSFSDYAEFTTSLQYHSLTSALQFIYGKVDFATYTEVYKGIKSLHLGTIKEKAEDKAE